MYVKTNWENRNPAVPINDANLNKIENGIEAAHITADAAAGAVADVAVDLQIALQDIVDLQAGQSDLQQDIADVSADTTAVANMYAAYYQWRTITVDPGANIPLSNVDNVHFSVTDAGADGTVSCILPATPVLNAQIRINDAGQDFAARPLNIKQNSGKLIMGVNDSLFLDTTNESITLVWTGNEAWGWAVISKT